MTPNESIALLILCVAVYVIACDVLRAGRMRSLKDRLIQERNRNRFGELRTKLVRMAIKKEIDPHSGLFPGFYRGLTALMRNPQQFENAAVAVLTLPVPERPGATKPTRAEGMIASDFAKRLDLLCRDYAGTYAAGAWLIDRLDKKGHPLWVQMLALRAQRKHAESMMAARERLERTAQLAQA